MSKIFRHPYRLMTQKNVVTSVRMGSFSIKKLAKKYFINDFSVFLVPGFSKMILINTYLDPNHSLYLRVLQLTANIQFQKVILILNDRLQKIDRLTDGDRADIVETCQIYYIDFLQRYLPNLSNIFSFFSNLPKFLCESVFLSI